MRRTRCAVVVVVAFASLGFGCDVLIRKAFVKNARAYARAKGISYASFREIGLPADVERGRHNSWRSVTASGNNLRHPGC
jgi:hypothetical protein